MKNILFKLTLLGILLLAACKPAQQPDSGQYPVKIPDTTKVSDETTRKALTAYNSETGVMRFSQATAVLNNLKTNDVLVSDISDAAPYGYLRKVKSIRREGTEVVLETEQAKLTDAVHSGTLVIEAPQPSGSQSVSSQEVKPQLDIGGGVGAGLLIDQNFERALCLDDANCNAGKVTFKGRGRASLGYRIQLGVEVDLIDGAMAYFEASAGADLSASFSILGEFSGNLKKETVVGEDIEIVKGSIGPVPIVVVITSELLIGAEGSASGNFSVGASPTLSATVGLRWTSNDGFKFFPGPQMGLNFTPPTGGVNVSAQGYALANIHAKLYGVFGPKIVLKGGLELEAGYPRDPLWTVFGRVFGHLDFKGLVPIIKIPFDLSKTLFDERFKVGDAPIQPPVITLKQPSTSVTFKKPTNLYDLFSTSDPQGRTVSVVGSSNRDGTLSSLNHAFTTPGPRVLTFTASNGDKTAQAQMNVDAINYAPSAQGLGSSSTPVGIPLFLNATGHDLNEPQNRLDCSRLRWTSSGSDIITTETGSSFGCQPKISFAESGPRSFTVTATDPEGLSNSQNISVEVSDRPAQLPPLVDRIEINSGFKGRKLQNGEEVLSREGLTLSVPVDNPDGSPVNFEWSVEQVPRPESCTPTIFDTCASFYTPRRVKTFSQNQATLDWIALGSDMPGFKYPTEKRCVPVFGQPGCEIQDVNIPARLLVSLRVTSSVAPDVVQNRSFVLQLSPQDIGPK